MLACRRACLFAIELCITAVLVNRTLFHVIAFILNVRNMFNEIHSSDVKMASIDRFSMETVVCLM